MASEQGIPVYLYIYDLTNGLASVLSPALLAGSDSLLIADASDSQLGLGRQVEGVWHTSVVAFEREYFFGASGIVSCSPGGTQLGAPQRTERLGDTFVPFNVFVDYIQGLSTSSYAGGTYHLLEHNCNHFSEEVALFLCGAHVPKYVLLQPEALPPALRLALGALLDSIAPAGTQAVFTDGLRQSRQESPDFRSLNDQVEQARVVSAELGARRSRLADKLARKERRKEKKRRKHAAAAGDGADGEGNYDESEESQVNSNRSDLECGGAGGDMAEALVEEASAGPSVGRPEDELDRRHAEELRRRQADPPIVYTDIDGEAEFSALVSALERSGLEFSEEDKQSLDELRQYLVLGEGSWVLGDDFLAFIGRLLTEGAVRCAALRCLCACACREDVSLVLHQDRRHHALLATAHNIDRMDLDDQRATALFMCNLFSNVSSSEWLLYISEWEANGTTLSNIRVTTKVCVHALLSEDGELRERGAALLHNIAAKEVKTVVFDEVCVELGMAALQALSAAPALSEEHTYRVLRALARLAQHSPDVPQLVAMVGPHPSAFKGTSPRVDEQVDLLLKRVK